ncbi:MAG: nucleoside deaminase [Bacteroidia bacterium]|nr:nucleoside deaminase [Bacteroidia bacterium]MDW8158432.1 nucleoside deaminase [Bacteroidia bacterium]
MYSPTQWMEMAIALAQEAVISNHGGPFGCIIVQNGQIIGKGHNQVLLLQDPTAHAEIVAIRDACRNVGSFELHNCEMYTSCEPCPMCLGAIYWARLKVVYYANTRAQAALIGFDDEYIYKEIEYENHLRTIPFIQILPPKAMLPFQLWSQKEDKQLY